MKNKDCVAGVQARVGWGGSVKWFLLPTSPWSVPLFFYCCEGESFDAIDLGGGQRRGDINILADAVASQPSLHSLLLSVYCMCQ